MTLASAGKADLSNHSAVNPGDESTIPAPPCAGATATARRHPSQSPEPNAVIRSWELVEPPRRQPAGRFDNRSSPLVPAPPRPDTPTSVAKSRAQTPSSVRGELVEPPAVNPQDDSTIPAPFSCRRHPERHAVIRRKVPSPDAVIRSWSACRTTPPSTQRTNRQSQLPSSCRRHPERHADIRPQSPEPGCCNPFVVSLSNHPAVNPEGRFDEPSSAHRHCCLGSTQSGQSRRALAREASIQLTRTHAASRRRA